MRALLICMCLALAASARYAEYAAAVEAAAKDASPQNKELLWEMAFLCANTKEMAACEDIYVFSWQMPPEKMVLHLLSTYLAGVARDKPPVLFYAPADVHASIERFLKNS